MEAKDKDTLIKLLVDYYNKCEVELLPDSPGDRNFYTIANIQSWPTVKKEGIMTKRPRI